MSISLVLEAKGRIQECHALERLELGDLQCLEAPGRVGKEEFRDIALHIEMVVKTESILTQLLVAFEKSSFALAVTMAPHIDREEVVALICKVPCHS